MSKHSSIDLSRIAELDRGWELRYSDKVALLSMARRLIQLESALEWCATHHRLRPAVELQLQDQEHETFADATLATARALGWDPQS